MLLVLLLFGCTVDGVDEEDEEFDGEGK